MQYRSVGKLGDVSALGFGAMRLPTMGGNIDEEAAQCMLRLAIDEGVNYVDTAYPYHEGKGEEFVGRALRNGYRDKVLLATKLPSWEVNTATDFDRYLDIQLARLQADYLDVYLLHSLNKSSWAKLRDLGVYEWAERAIADGRFHYLGFSFHDDFETFKTIIDDYDWALSQIQYNFMDIANQAGTAGLQYAASRNIPVVVMEPLLGGKLIDPPAPVQRVWDASPSRRTAAAWALDWLWNQPGVSLVLSGMSTMEQVRENIALAEHSGVGTLSDDDLALYDLVRQEYERLIAIPCTGCGYCAPCPQGVDIPGNFAVYNEAIMYDKPESARGQYAWQQYAYEVQHIFDHDVRAARCVQCGICEAKCPQHVPISSWMPHIHAVLSTDARFTREPKLARQTVEERYG